MTPNIHDATIKTMGFTLRSSKSWIISMLPEEDQRVARVRFGLDNGGITTVQDVATICNVSIDDVQRVEEQVIQMLTGKGMK